MPKVSDQAVNAVVRDILDDPAPTPAAVERLRARAAAETPAQQAELRDRVREKNLPLLGSESGLAP